ncbi:PQQ-binding-like beta-propeller repeat protein [Streptomyces tuirus]|nr:PQQ-binding-like beta-propeller repeat protein [Streptomyces tuirus]
MTALAGGLALLVGGAWVFLSDSGYWPGASMTTAWEAPYDRNANEHGNRAWLVGDTMVRSRFDAVTGFDAGSGKQRWEYVPSRADICATSPTADQSVALLLYGEPRSDCRTLAALDLTTGRELWRTTAMAAAVETGAGLGVFLDGGDRSVRAVDLRSGAARWTAAVPKGCVAQPGLAAARHVLAVVNCGEEMKLVAFDPADGQERWTVPLDSRRGVPADTGAALVSADPVVVRVGKEEGSGAYSYRAFGPGGRPQGVVDEVGRHGDIIDATVADGRLYATARYQGRQSTLDRFVAFDLATGEELWREDVGGGGRLVGLHAASGRVMAIWGSSKYGDQLRVLDAATGDEEEDRAFRDSVDGVVSLFPYEDLVIVFCHGQGARPFTAYERW